MASKPSLVAFVVEQLGRNVTAKKMFGEYGIYREAQLIALFCDDQLFMKPTEAGRALLGEVDEASPYPGAKLACEVKKRHSIATVIGRPRVHGLVFARR